MTEFEELNDELDSFNLCLDALNSQWLSLNTRARELLEEMRQSGEASQHSLQQRMTIQQVL